MTSLSLFGEHSLTIVAARYDDCGSAERAACVLRDILHGHGEVHVVGPRDPALAQKLQPDQDGIFRTLVRTHLLLGGSGGLLGAVIAALVTAIGSFESALTAVMLSALIGVFLGSIVAGCLTLRPDQDLVAQQVTDWGRRYKWAVVAHPIGPGCVQRTLAALHRTGAKPVRSL